MHVVHGITGRGLSGGVAAGHTRARAHAIASAEHRAAWHSGASARVRRCAAAVALPGGLVKQKNTTRGTAMCTYYPARWVWSTAACSARQTCAARVGGTAVWSAHGWVCRAARYIGGATEKRGIVCCNRSCHVATGRVMLHGHQERDPQVEFFVVGEVRPDHSPQLHARLRSSKHGMARLVNRPCHICAGTGLAAAHICAGTGLAPATSGLGPSLPIGSRTGLTPYEPAPWDWGPWQAFI